MKPYGEIALILSKNDSVLKKVIESVHREIRPTPSVDIYLSLQNSIVSQQLSVKVVEVIWRRFIDLFSDGYPSAEKVLSYSDQELRSVGLSNSKVKYIKNAAAFSIENDISFEYLNSMTDAEIITYLTQIKGVGTWTVQMILMFPMDRPSVFPIDDLGIQSHMKYWYKLDLEKRELHNKLLEIASKWQPYQTLACKYLWESKDQ